MKSHQRMKRKIQLAFGSAVLTLLAVGALSYRTIIVSNESELWVQHTHEVLEDLQGVLLASQSIEAAYRGFVLTGDESHLSRYQADIARLRRNQATLATLIEDNPTQQNRLPTLLKLEEQKLQFAESVIRLRRTQGFEAAAALVRTADGEHIMDAFRDLIRTMRREEQALLTERTQAAKKRLSQTKIAMILSVLLGMSIATAAAWNVHRESLQRTVAEHALRESETKFRGLLEAAPDAMIVFDQAGTIVLLNLQTEKHFGYRREELVTQNILKIIPLGFAERFTGQQASSQSAGQVPGQFLGQVSGRGQVQSQVIELFGRRKDTSEFPLEIMVSPLESAKGLRMIAAIRNITERKKSEERLAKAASELRRSNIELQQFAYVASHDLQEPLRMVASYTQLLAKRYTGKLDPDADQFIAYAVDGCSRMKRLIEDLLAYSRAGTQARDLRESASESALKEALTNLRTAIQESAATITHDPMPTLVTDHSLLVQVLQNLVGNAIKYRSEAAPQVHVGARKNGVNEWIFSVRDNGLGIDPQYYEKIFQLFQRLHGRGELEGTGIGLAICKKLIERLGGRIWVESQPQKGSTFYFALPEVVTNQTQTQTQSDSPSTVLNPIAIEQNLRSSATFPASL